MDKNMKKKIAAAVALVLIAVLSMTLVKDTVTAPDFHAKTIESLEETEGTVMKLTAASLAVSTAISMLPGDTAMPIADKISDLSGYLLIVLCAVFLEKYLLTLTGYATFLVLIPAACALYILYLFAQRDGFRVLAKKLTAFGLVIFLMVPGSVAVSNLIEDTYDASMQTTIESADDISDKADDSGFLNKIPNLKDKAEQWFKDMIKAIAVMIVTSCLIPIFVLMAFIWLVKTIFGINISVPKRKKQEEAQS